LTRLYANGDEYRNTVSVKELKVELWGLAPSSGGVEPVHEPTDG